MDHRLYRLKIILMFLLIYLSWDAYALVYPYIGRWSVNVLPYLLRLPMTSYSFEHSLVSWTVSHRCLHVTMRAIYRAGFAGSFWLPALYLVARKPQRAWNLARRFAIGFGILALSFVVFHVYAPHLVYTLPEHYAPNDWTARPEFVLPSPHCTLAFTGLITLIEFARLEALPIEAFLLLVPISTVLLGEHWFWDALVGLIVALLAVELEKRV